MVKKLYGSTLSENAVRAEMVLRELGVEFEFVPVDILKGENREDWYKKVNPRGQVPAFDDDGVVLVESVAITQYAQAMYGTEASNSLLSSDKAELALCYQLIAQWHEKLGPKNIIGTALFGGGTKQSLAPRIEALKAEWKVWDELLVGKQYFTGSKLTLIDCIVLPFAYNAFKVLSLPPAEYPNLNSWLERMLARPSTQQIEFFGPNGSASKFGSLTRGIGFLE